MISFLDLGVGAVVRSSFYKPLADQDDESVSRVAASAGRFFKKIARIMVAYMIILIFGYPLIVNQNYGFAFTAALIAAMSISNVAQYYFGIVDRLLLSADQMGYIQYNAQTVTIVMNTVAGVLLISFGASIQFVKLTTSVIFTLRPLYLHWYVNRHYKINRKISYQGEPIQQKWNGFAQHLAAVVLDGTDMIVLSVFSVLSDVSVYSVYHLVLNGVKQLVISMTSGVQSLFGELWAKQELEELNTVFSWTEWAIHTGTTFVYGCAAVLVVPFVRVYTRGISDVNYAQPLFAVLLVLANAGHCLRLPYNNMILAAGHYQQTQHNYIIAMILNIVISITTVKLWGLVGVAVGTLAAMVYQTIWMAWYHSRQFIHWPFRNFIKQIGVDALTAVVASLLSSFISLNSLTYLGWVMMAVPVALIWITVIAAVNNIFYREMLIKLCDSVKSRLLRKNNGRQG